MNKPELYNEDFQATYCPEDDKLRLYVGRVQDDEYAALRAEGWKSTPKQSEAGGGEFAATWTPAREQTAESYAGIILDEDMGPEERAADRAERFAGYRDKRLGEAYDHADRYDRGPMAHGHQSQAKADREARRHDRQATHAVSAWSKADYWTHRTAGVIENALYKSTPSVRMGRIKKLEAQQRKHTKSHTEARDLDIFRHRCAVAIIEHAEGKSEKIKGSRIACAYAMSDIRDADGLDQETKLDDAQLRRMGAVAMLADVWHSDKLRELRSQARTGEKTREAVAAEYLELVGHDEPEPWDPEKNGWANHYALRLAYERQMLEAAGGRAGELDIIPGGFVGNMQVIKVNKSKVSGRVVSVAVKTEKVKGYTYRTSNVPHADYALTTIRVERLSQDAYRAPTTEELETFEAWTKADRKERAAKAKKVGAPKLLNPTLEDARRIQAVWNEESKGSRYGSDPDPEVLQMTQAQYSENSKGSYSHYETVDIRALGHKNGMRGGEHSPYPTLCRIRATYRNIIVLTDKPQKALPAEVWIDPAPAALEEVRANWDTFLKSMQANYRSDQPSEQIELFRLGRIAGICCWNNGPQWRGNGLEIMREMQAKSNAEPEALPTKQAEFALA